MGGKIGSIQPAGDDHHSKDQYDIGILKTGKRLIGFQYAGHIENNASSGSRQGERKFSAHKHNNRNNKYKYGNCNR